MNNNFKKLLALVISLMLCLSFAACGDKTEGTEDASADADITTEEEATGISFDEEDEDALIVKADADDSQFCGTWKATSDYASYMYGNITITIKEDGTWEGNITDTDMTGTWSRDGQDLIFTNEYLTLSMCFTENGTLVMQRNLADEGDDEEMVNTVLVKE